VIKLLKEFKFQTIFLGTRKSGKSLFINKSIKMSICNINNAPDVPKKKDKVHKNIFRETAWNINFYDSSILMEVQKIFFSREVSASLHNSTIFEYMQDPINFTNEGDLFYYLSNHFKYEEVKQEVPPGYELA